MWECSEGLIRKVKQGSGMIRSNVNVKYKAIGLEKSEALESDWNQIWEGCIIVAAVGDV